MHFSFVKNNSKWKKKVTSQSNGDLSWSKIPLPTVPENTFVKCLLIWKTAFLSDDGECLLAVLVTSHSYVLDGAVQLSPTNQLFLERLDIKIGKSHFNSYTCSLATHMFSMATMCGSVCLWPLFLCFQILLKVEYHSLSSYNHCLSGCCIPNLTLCEVHVYVHMQFIQTRCTAWTRLTKFEGRVGPSVLSTNKARTHLLTEVITVDRQEGVVLFREWSWMA